MDVFRPVLVHLVWGGGISYQNGWLNGDSTSLRTSFPLLKKIDLSTLTEMAYRYVGGVDRASYSLKLILWYDFNGNVCRNEITDDGNLETMYFLAQMNTQYVAQFEVQIDQLMPTQQSGFVDQLRNVEQSSHFVQSEVDCPSTSHTRIGVHDQEEDDGDEDDEDVDSGDGISTASDDTVESFSNEEPMSDDSGNAINAEEVPQTNIVVSRFGFVDEEVESSKSLPFNDEDELAWDCWCKEDGEIRRGMVFKSKAELLYAVRAWNIKRNREIFIKDTRPYYFKAICYTNGKNYSGTQEPRMCMWGVSGSNRNKEHVWRVVKWEDSHNCYGNVRGNNNRCLTSSLIANDIMSQIQKNIAYPVKHIQAHVKQAWSVDVTYAKAWNARRIAIERMFGTWQSNFAELPRYLNELVYTNPETVVEFSHGPQTDVNVVTFRYIFWAFGPPIQAFQTCIPVVCVDGTHLKGNYIGKLLTAVAKNANGQILPVAFAIVDQETNESWAWFLDQFRTHVAAHSDRELCVISDRHAGILNAVSNMQGWHHRYCLRHVRSNLMKKFKNHELKKLCWTTGATTQSSTYTSGIRAIKSVDVGGWKYLKEADPVKWSLYRDTDQRRWGNTTTNIAESLNNVLRHSRMMPIKACIEFTFDYTRNHFVKQYESAMRCTSPLSKRMWRQYEIREARAATYTTTVYNELEGIYKVHSTYQNSIDQGTDFTVKFEERKCSCGKWQHQRFPCSHAIAVCGYRNVNVGVIISNKYKTTRWRNQYNHSFHPLRDHAYWTNPGWYICADPSKLVTNTGRRRSRRIPNEMDERDSSSRQPPRCRICKEQGHNKSTCPTRR